MKKPLQFVQPVERFTWAERVDIERFKSDMNGIAGFGLGGRCGKERQVIQPRGKPAGRIAPRFQL